MNDGWVHSCYFSFGPGVVHVWLFYFVYIMQYPSFWSSAVFVLISYQLILYVLYQQR